ncbi:hypothetical protein [Mesorhizobium sp.]|uniref:hypothetical protein n=1 Tax=Mesorhizobium sp. TaxID=1871066 RepID=UPI0026CC20AD
MAIAGVQSHHRQKADPLGGSDIAENRPLLSRWHPDFADVFKKGPNTDCCDYAADAWEYPSLAFNIVCEVA